MNVDGELGAPLQQDAEPQLNAADTFFCQPTSSRETALDRYTLRTICLVCNYPAPRGQCLQLHGPDGIVGAGANYY